MLGSTLASRYEIREELGRGGMGVVFRAHDWVLSRDVAVKLVPRGQLTPDLEARFRREAQLVAQLDHPAIVPIHDLGRDEATGALFFVMPVVPGRTLRSRLNEGRPSLGLALDTAIQVADALEYSHARDVIHRDVKPENLMIAEGPADTRVRVMDFGLAKTRAVKGPTDGGLVVGTLAYLSPEQVRAEDPDGRTDIYSLGVVLYECLVGEPPFAGDVSTVMLRILKDLPASPRTLGVAIDEELERIVLRCLEKRPELRPRLAGELADELKRYRARLNDSDRRALLVATPQSSRAARTPAAPYVGRQEELSQLRRRLDLAASGECHLVILSGEVGLGKTRLVQEVETLARARRIRVLRGRFAELDQRFPYQAFCDLVQDFFRVADAEAARGVDLSDVAPELVALFPILSEIGPIRAAAGGTAPPGARSPEEPTAIYDLLARTLARLAGGRPLVLVLESLHQAEFSNEALPYVVRRLGGTPTLVLGTYATDELDRKHPLLRLLDGFRGDSRFLQLALRPLPEAEHRVLVASLLGGGSVSDPLARRLFDTSEGNPYFTKELVRSLEESGGLERDASGTWDLSRAAYLREGVLPETVQQAVERRVQRLEKPLRDVLSVASVIGRSFEVRDLEGLLGGEAEDALDRLVAEGLVEEEPESRGRRLSFTSRLVREVLYSGVPRRRRRALHESCAQLLEARHAGRNDRVLTSLVYHYARADVAEKAVPLALRASRKALEAFSLEDAVRAARTALDFLVDAGREADVPREAEARLLLATALRAMGDLDGAIAEAERVESACRTEPALAARRVKALSLLAETSWEALRTDEARRHVEAGVEAARGPGSALGADGDPESLSRLLSLGATLASLRGDGETASVYLEERARLELESSPRPATAPRGGTVVVAMANPVLSIDPAHSKTLGEVEVLACCFESLTTVDPDGHVLPDLCERIVSEEGGCRYVVTLRPDVTFQDGVALTAAHVKQSIERTLRLSGANPPPAFAVLRRRADGQPDVDVVSETTLVLRLEAPAPSYGALLTDVRTGVAREVTTPGGATTLVGTGPFRLIRQGRAVILDRNDRWWRGAPALLDTLEFRPDMPSEAIAAGLRSGSIDVARDLLPEDLDEVLRDPVLRTGMVEAPKKATYFILFNTFSPLGGNPALRAALAGVIDTHALVWQSLGRFAQPAVGLIPPGILGHDSGRRRTTLRRDQALEKLREAGVSLPLQLRISVPPAFLEQLRGLSSSLFARWSALGVEVRVVTPTFESFLESFGDPGGVDLLIGRWTADYDDPDNFTFDLFHSRHGVFRQLYRSPETDRQLEEARTLSQPDLREEVVRRFERRLVDEAILAPLFHEQGYRIAGPKVSGLRLTSHPPFVNYHRLAKAQRAVPATRALARHGVARVPLVGDLRSLDPALCDTVEANEVQANLTEPLTCVTDGAQIVPWLAKDFRSEERGRRFRFFLREGVRFHDGRRLTARDVRFTLERLVRTEGAVSPWILSRVRGARELAEGRADDLAGLRIVSPLELTIELEEPLGIFPTLLSHPVTGIVAEGSDPSASSWKDGYVGTGPFRLASFVPHRRAELEAHPSYWREGLPRIEGLVFHPRVPPDEIFTGFRSGAFALASDLRPEQAESLRLDVIFGPKHRQKPLLCTHFLAANVNRRPLADRATRERLFSCLDVRSLVGRHLGKLAIPAGSLIPPGILPRRRADLPEPLRPNEATSIIAPLVANVQPVFQAEYERLAEELFATLAANGFRVARPNRTMGEYTEAQARGEADLVLGRWIADYPDPDSFASILHTRSGFLGRTCGSSELDELIERGGAEADVGTRRSTYLKLEERIWEDRLLLPLFHEQLYRFARPEVRGLELTFGSPYVRYELISLDA